jgi:hypothetical protein
MTRCSILVFWTVAALASARAQNPPVRGPFSAFPQAVSLPLPGEQLLIKASGDGFDAVPYVAVPPGKPDFRLESLFPSGTVRNVLDLDAISTGNDNVFLVPGQPGRINLGAGNVWAAIHFSVSTDSIGDPGSTVRSRVGPGIGSDLFGFYVPGSLGIDPSLPGNVFVEQLFSDMNFQSGEDVDALDLMLPLIVQDDAGASSPFTVLFAPNQDKLYFSVTSASATAIDAVEPSFFGNAPASGATLLRVVWQGTSWSSPELVKTPSELDLPDAADIDALSVNTYAGGALIFSIAPPPSGSPPLYSNSNQELNAAELYVLLPLPQTLTTLKLPNGDPVRPALHLRTDDNVDGLCSSDPDIDDYCHMFGVPTPAGARRPLGLSICRTHRVDELSRRSLTMVVSGWSVLQPQPGYLHYFHYVPSAPASIGQVTLWLSQPRSALQHVVQTEVGLSPSPALTGLDLSVVVAFTPLHGVLPTDSVWSYGSTFQF